MLPLTNAGGFTSGERPAERMLRAPTGLEVDVPGLITIL